jgi:hypothetical protein
VRRLTFFYRPAQYTRQFKKWNLTKNASQETYRFISHRIRKRNLEGKNGSEVYIGGELIPMKKIKKEISRHVLASAEHLPLPSKPSKRLYTTVWSRRGMTDLITSIGQEPQTPPGILVCTPAADDSIPVVGQEPQGVLVCTPAADDSMPVVEPQFLPFFQFQGLLRASGTCHEETARIRNPFSNARNRWFKGNVVTKL